MQGNILSLSQNRNNAKMLTSALHQSYFSISQLSDPNQIPNTLKSRDFDVIVLHHDGSTIDAFAICKRLKRQTLYAHIPVVICVDHETDLDWGRAVNSFADAMFLLNGETTNEILARLKFLARDHSAFSALKKQVRAEAFGALQETQDAFQQKLRIIALSAELRKRFPDAGTGFRWTNLADRGNSPDTIFVPAGLTQEIDIIKLRSDFGADCPPIICEHDPLYKKPQRQFLEIGADDVFAAGRSSAALELQIRSTIRRKSQRKNLERRIAECVTIARFDPLTELLNRRAGLEMAQRAFAAATKADAALSVIMIDIDHFKNVNDQFGHLVGDQVLTAVAKKMKTALRGADILCRYGGEEFLILLPKASQEQADIVIQRLQRALRTKHNPSLPRVTISAGIAARNKSHTQVTDMILEADKALYEAKLAGRDRRCVYLDDPIRHRQAV